MSYIDNWLPEKSRKWKDNERVHFNDILQSKPGLMNDLIEYIPGNLEGRKHFEDKYCKVKPYKPLIRTFQERLSETEVFGKRGIKEIKPKFSVKKDRAELRHILEGNCQTEWKYQSFKTGPFPGTTMMSKDTYFEDEMQRKGKGLSSFSTGNKPFRFPEYCTDFFKEGGLVSGSSIKVRKPLVFKKNSNERAIQMNNTKLTSTFKQREKDENRKIDEYSVSELATWEQTILPEANPNYRDPDKFGLPDIKAEIGKKDVKKDSKKTGKK